MAKVEKHFLLTECTSTNENGACSNCRKNLCQNLEEQCFYPEVATSNDESKLCCECGHETLFNGSTCVDADECACLDDQGEARL